MQKKVRKEKSIRIRIDEDDYKEIKELSESLGYKNMSEFIRNSIKMFSMKKENNDCVKSDSLSYHLSRIGNNLNQLAYVINKANIKNKVNDKLVEELLKELVFININLSKLR